MTKDEILARIESVAASDMSSMKKLIAIEDLNFAYNMLDAIETGALDCGKPRISLTSSYKEVKGDCRGVRTILQENGENSTC